MRQGFCADSRTGSRRLSRKKTKKTNRLRRCQTESLEARIVLAGDLVGHWVAEDLQVEPEGFLEWQDRVNQVEASRSAGDPAHVAGALGGRSVVRFDAADGGDMLEVSALENPVSQADDFTIVVALATTTSDLVGGNGEWYQNTGLVNSNTLGFSPDWGISLNAAGQAAFGLGAGLGQPSPTVYSTTAGLNDGDLHVITATRSGSDLALYVDDQPADTRSDASAATRARLDLAFGGMLNRVNYFTGDIAEVRMYNGALTAEEVSTVYSEVFSFYNNSLPTAVADQYQATEDVVLNIDVANGVLANDSDVEGDELTAILDTEPANGTVTLSPDGSFQYIPNPDFSGFDLFSYRAADFRESRATAVSITVAPVHDAPSVADEQYFTMPTEPLSIPFFLGVLVNDSSVEGLDLTAEVARDVESGSLNLNADGSFLFDPEGVAGEITFTYRANDGVTLSEEATVSIIVNTPPSPTADTYQAVEDQTLVVGSADGALSNDNDVDGNPFTAILTADPSHGVLNLQDDGSFEYTPNENYFGSDQFSYRLTDGIDESSEVVVQLNIEAANDAPSANSDGYFAFVDEVLEVPAGPGVLANDTDVDSAELTAALVEGPTNGTLTFRPDGSFTYTPNAGFDGSDSFTYRASDGDAESEAVSVSLRITSQPMVISEFMASNADTLTTILRNSVEDDFEGEVLSPDWIELRNFLTEPINLGGMHLSDDPRFPTKWTFPEGTIIPGDGFLVVFASGENILNADLDEQGFLHTNFALSTDGGSYLGIYDTSERLIHAVGESYPDQRTHISYGVPGVNADEFGYFMTPTPGEANGESRSSLVADTSFSVDRGFYSEPFEVAVTTTTEGATIRYTTDGTDPTLENGTDYTGPMTISQTTTLRAAAFKEGLVPTNVDTHSYVFVTDVLGQDRQATLDAGFPERWRNQTSDYGIDADDQLPTIAGDASMSLEEAQAAIVESLQSIPSMSFVMDIDDMFGNEGIYSNPNSTGENWERATSVELLNPDGSDGFQIDAGVRIQGGAFRGFGLTRKKSFRLLFKSNYGPSKLNYPLFGADANSSYDTLILRMESNDGWQWNGAGGQPQYARDQYLRNVQRAMGHPSPEGTSIHLYINGFYWGLYNIVERPDQSMGEAYFGSEKYDWDGINSGTPVNENGDRFRSRRTRTAWNTMFSMARDVDNAETEEERTALFMQLQGLNPDGSNNPEYEDWLDVENMIDYLIVNYYGDNSDWPFKNYYVGRENSPDSTGFKFFMWDAEWSLLLRSSVNGNKVNDARGVAAPFQELRASEEFRVMFGDRIQKHFFNGGVFYVDPENPDWDPEHPERNVPASMYSELAEFVYPALIAESARWGDQHSGRPRTVADWQREYDRIMETWFPRRSEVMLRHYDRAGLFPDVETARFNQRGGAISKDFEVELTAPAGTIYYTTDGSDPRMIGGSINPDAIAYDGSFNLLESAEVRVRVLDNDEWSAIDETSFIVDVTPADENSLRISEFLYHPTDPNDEEVRAGHTDADDFEFMEFVNISDQTIDLSNIVMRKIVVDGDEQGISFDFASGEIQLLAPGERLVLVEDVDAFRFRYGDSAPVAGQWSGGLSNRSETITMASGEEIIHQFTYTDEWHPSTDGNGPSLEIVDVANPNLESWGTAEGWRPSGINGGSPGTGGRVLGDANGDGVFDSSDLVQVMQAGKFEDGVPNNATYEEGDFDGDGDFTTSDLVLVFQAGTYADAVAARQAAIAAALADLTQEERRLEETHQLDVVPGEERKPTDNELGVRDHLFDDDYESLLDSSEDKDESTKDQILGPLNVPAL